MHRRVNGFNKESEVLVTDGAFSVNNVYASCDDVTLCNCCPQSPSRTVKPPLQSDATRNVAAVRFLLFRDGARVL